MAADVDLRIPVSRDERKSVAATAKKHKVTVANLVRALLGLPPRHPGRPRRPG